MKIGIIREGKVPPDFRVPLTPSQCKQIKETYPTVNVVVQSSPIRAFKDDEYRHEGIEVVDDLNDCDVIFGVKEVPMDMLIPDKTFVFFSHTIKKQPYNRKLLQTILKQKIRLIDYEVIKDINGKRLIGFGRYAGIVGCYNSFLTYGVKSGHFVLKAAHACEDRKEVEKELKKVILPKDFKVVLTGFGRVGHGAREILKLLPIQEVSPEEYLHKSFDYPVFTHLEVNDYYYRTDGGEFNKKEFYSQAQLYSSDFEKYTLESDMYIPCHYWSSEADFILKRESLMSPYNRIKVVGDISCDIDGPIACTIRPSKIGNSMYGYSPISNSEVDIHNPNAIAVMAVDNLPCELPKDASEDFGSELIKHVLPALLGDDPDRVIDRASETNFQGTLNPEFEYLEDYIQ